MNNFYSFKPVDTLCFKGSESAEMGADHTASSFFPPAPQTISGAVRTEYLKQHNIDFSDYAVGKVDEKVINEIGKAGEKAPFMIVGPLFRKDKKIYIPAPYNRYVLKEDMKEDENNCKKIIKSRIEKSPLFVSHSEAIWAKGENVETIGGRWILLEDIDKDEMTILPLSDFALPEEHTGIAIDSQKRTVREGHLYTFRHFRLKEDVEILFGIDKEIDLSEKGVLKIGAEQRFGRYEKEKEISIERDIKSGLFMSLSMIEGGEEANSSIVAAGKIQYLGGWDMVKGFHKPMKGYFPAGSVFNKKLNSNFIEI